MENPEIEHAQLSKKLRLESSSDESYSLVNGKNLHQKVAEDAEKLEILECGAENLIKPQNSDLTLLDVFDNMYLRRIVKENHGSEIKVISLNFVRKANDIMPFKKLSADERDVQIFKDFFSPTDSNTINSDSSVQENGTDLSSNQETEKKGKFQDPDLKTEIGQSNKVEGSENPDTLAKTNEIFAEQYQTNPRKDPEDYSNVLLTVSSDQASIYDNEHCGDHLDIMSNYHSDKKDSLIVGCWVPAKLDSIFALGDLSGNIKIISVSRSKEIAIIEAHRDKIIDIQPFPATQLVILSVSADGKIRMWNIETKKCLLEIEYCATAASFSLDGKFLATGSDSGEVRLWDISSFDKLKYGGENSEFEQPKLRIDDSVLISPGKKLSSARNDCIRLLKDKILSRNVSGKFELHEIDSKKLIRAFLIPDNEENSCKFDISYDENYVCVGNSHGIVYIFDLEAGKVVKKLIHKRSVRPIKCCIFTKNNRSIIYGSDSSFLWRYDYIDKETVKAYEALSN